LGVPDPADAHDGGSPHDRRRDGTLPRLAQPRAGRRPRDQHRRGRGLPRRGEVDQAPRRGRGRADRVTAPTPPRERLGAIDVGSNSIGLVVAEWDPVTGLEIIDEVKDQPRLATGVARHGALDPEAMEAAFAALSRMTGVAERRGVTRLSAVATSAMRDATNGPAFAERIRRELGIPLVIIDEDREAQLSWRSVAHHFRLEETRAIVADIGGGSLELV